MKFMQRLLCLFILILSCSFGLSAAEWQRPSFAGHEAMFVAVVKESTVEDAIAAIDLAEEKGAMGIDLHLNYLYDAGLLTEENVGLICRSTALPILAINYDGTLSQEARLETLLLAVRAGCAAVDLPGFMYCSGATSKTHTAENIAYWEKLGYDMSFVKAVPSETVIDPSMIEKQKEYIDTVHSMGAEVLRSFHVKTVFTAEQAIAYLRFQDQIGADVLKLVGYGYTKDDVAACVEVCKTLRDDAQMQTRFSYHLSGGVGGRITRILCPTFYGSYIAFCYPVLTDRQDADQLDLDMAVQCLAAKKNASEDISVDDALRLLSAASVHPDLTARIRQYENCMTVGKAYASSSDLSKRWSFDGDTYTYTLRESSSTSSYNLRAYAYDSTKPQKGSVYIAATVSGDFTPHVSATRVPKVGVYIGTEEKMLALVYNTDAKTVDLVCNSENAFTLDQDIKKDVLLPVGVLDKRSYTVDVAAGESIRLGMHLTDSVLELYAGTETAEKIAELPIGTELLSRMQKNADGSYNAGVLAELYMGNASKGRENAVTFTDVVYGKLPCDINGDGAYTVRDAVGLIALLANKAEGEDISGDGRFTLLDILFVVKKCIA